MKAIRLTLVFGAVLVSASPGVSQFVKAALGFRLGYSPTERGYGQKPLILADNKKAVGVQLLSGVNGHTGWGNVGTARLATAGSAYGVGLQGGGKQEGPLQAHVGNGAVRHLKILGLNLYLGGRAAPLAQGLGWKQPVAAASSAYGAPYAGAYSAPYASAPYASAPYASAPYSAPAKKPFSLLPLTLAHKPFFALPSFGYKARQSHHGNLIGGAAGVRASVGTPGYGVGFNLGYKQGINTKSPLGYALGLGGPRGPGPRGWSSPIYKGADQVYIQGAPSLKTENTIILDTPIVTGLESQQQLTIQPMPTSQQQVDQQQEQQAQASQIQAVQVQPAQKPAGQHQGLQGPFRQSARPSIFNLFGLASHSRPSILRPSPLHYSFNNAQSPSQSQSHVRVLPNHHPPTPAPQFQRANIPNEVAPQAAGWSTLFPVASQQQQTPSSSILQNFVNPVPVNGQSLAKLQASLNGPVASAQNQVPYYQPQYSGGFGFPPRGLFSRSFRPPRAPIQQSSPQQQQQQYSSGFPGFANMFRGLYNAPFRPSQQSYVQPNLVQQQQQQQSPFAAQQSPSYLGLGQSAPLQLAQSTQPQQQQQVQNPDHYPRLPQIPFTADSMQFSPDPNFQYSHTISSSPVNMGTYTMNMNMGGNSGEQAGAASTPVFGPNGRRIKKLKRARQDIIIKKQDTTPTTTKDMMEASASSSSITMASSMGATQWTPLVYIDIPKLTRKSLDQAPVQTLRQQVRLQQQPQLVAVPEEQSLDRSKILKRRRLASEEATTTQTVIPSSAPTRSTTTTTTTSTTTTTTTPPPPSSSASPPAESVTTVSA